MKPAHFVHTLLSEDLRKMGHPRQWTEEQYALIQKLIGEGKMYEEEQKIKACSAEMISSALKWKAKPKRRGRKRKNSQNGKAPW